MGTVDNILNEGSVTTTLIDDGTITGDDLSSEIFQIFILQVTQEQSKVSGLESDLQQFNQIFVTQQISQAIRMTLQQMQQTLEKYY